MARSRSGLASLLALTVLAACSGDDPASKPAGDPTAGESVDNTIPKVPPSKVLVEAPQLVLDMTEQLKKVVDKAGAVQARQTIEMQLRVLRTKLPAGNENVQPRPTVFTGVLKGKEADVAALRAEMDRIAKLPECLEILKPFLDALKDLLV